MLNKSRRKPITPMAIPAGATHKWATFFYKKNTRGVWFKYHSDGEWYISHPVDHVVAKMVKL